MTRDYAPKNYARTRLDWPTIVQAAVTLGILHLMVFALLFVGAFVKG